MTVVNKVHATPCRYSILLTRLIHLVRCVRTWLHDEFLITMHSIICVLPCRLVCQESRRHNLPRLRHQGCQELVPRQLSAGACDIHWIKEPGKPVEVCEPTFANEHP